MSNESAAHASEGQLVSEKTTTPLNLTNDQKQSLNETTHLLASFKSEIEEKREAVSKKTSRLSSGYESLSTNPKEAAESFAKTEQQYNQFTSIFLSEVGQYLLYCSSHTTNEPPQAVAALSCEKLTLHLEEINKTVKKYIKKRRGELSVVFSRYEHSLNIHLRNMETVLVLAKQNKK